jgi:hypothetical protein
MLMYRAMLRQEAAERAHTLRHSSGGLTPEYLAESNRLRGVSRGTRLKIAALNQQMGRGMATTSLAYDKWEAGARRNPSRMAGARARLAAAQEGYAILTRAHGSSVVGWQEYKRAVARMSPAAILAEARASAGARSNPRAPKKEDRATKAVRRVTEAFKAGVILHWRGRTADGRRDDQGTAGYYRSGGRASHSTGTAEYAILGTPGRGGRDATFDTAFGAADHLVEWIGVTNAIDALKAAARKHGTEYVNLDTPIRWAPKSNPRKRNPRAKLTKDQKKALADYNFALSQEDRYLGSVFVTPSGQRRVEAVTEAAYARCKALGMTHEHGL